MFIDVGFDAASVGALVGWVDYQFLNYTIKRIIIPSNQRQ